MAATKILLVDDEAGILQLVKAYLEPEGYQVTTAQTGPEALALAQRGHFDLLVLDIMLPGMDGLEVLTQLRRTSDVYVILLTAKTEEIDKIIGLSVGADDYVTKPFSPRELTARIKAALRRIHRPALVDTPELNFSNLRIDLAGRRVWLDDTEIDLTTTEFDVLVSLAENAGRVLSREQLLENVWGHDYYGEIRVVDVHVGHVRQKIGEGYIETVRGVGYRFESEVQND